MVALGFPEHEACGTVHMVTAHGAQPLSATQSGRALPVKEAATFADEGKQKSWVSCLSQVAQDIALVSFASTIPWKRHVRCACCAEKLQKALRDATAK
jgi:hypothetical protein